MIKKNTYRKILMGLLTFFVASCGNDEIQIVPQPVPVSLKASVFSFGDDEGSYWKAGEEFGVFMVKAGTEEIVGNYSNLTYTADDYSATGYLIPTGDPMYYPIDGSKVDFIAYHPYKAMVARASGYQVTIDLSNQNKAKADDFIHSKEGRGKDASSGCYELQLKPVLSRLVIDMMPGAGITEAQLQKMKVALHGKNTMGVFDVVKGEFLSFSQPGEVDMKKSADSKTTHEAVIFPGAVADEMNVVVQMENEAGETVTLEVPLNDVVPHAEENTEYEVGLKVTPDGLEPTLVSTSPIYILDWQDDKENIEEEIGESLPNLVKKGKLDDLSVETLPVVNKVPDTPFTWYAMANQVDGVFDVYRDPKQGNVLSMNYKGALSWYKNYLGYTSQGAEAAGYQLTFKARSAMAGAKLQVYVRINKSGNHFFVLQDADLTKPCAAQVLALTTEWTTYVVNFDFTQTVNTLYTPEEGGVVATTEADRDNFYIAFAPQQAEVEYCIDDITCIKQE